MLMGSKVVKSNNNALISALFYFETANKLRCCPEHLKTDYGTENGGNG